MNKCMSSEMYHRKNWNKTSTVILEELHRMLAGILLMTLVNVC
jgi:hypothetical protein